MIFKNSKVYDWLKWIALVALDAIGLCYQTLANIWHLPYGDEVFKTCVALAILLGTLIGVSGVRYKRTTPDGYYIHAVEEETNGRS